MKSLRWKSALRRPSVLGLALVFGLVVPLAELAPIHAAAQAQPDPAPPATQPAPDPNANPVDLNWAPPALAQLGAQASTKTSFSLDRSEIGMAAALTGGNDEATKQAINKIDGISVRLLRFGPAGIGDEASVEAVRDAYHLRGWKHLVTTESGAKSPLHNGTTDLWLVLDGVNVRGAVVLFETPKSVTLVTLAGNLSPVDLLHLRGHFGIPRFEGSDFKDAKDK
jgi:hypothetical protein